MILVVGATGLLGTEVCRALRHQRQSVRALVRATSAPGKVDELRSLGCDLVAGDLKDAPSIGAACKGVTAIVSAASSTLARKPGHSIESVDLDGRLTLCRAAKKTGTRRITFVSFRDDPAVQYTRDASKACRRTRNQRFRFHLHSGELVHGGVAFAAFGFDYPNAKARIYGDRSKPISWVSYRDVRGQLHD
jgi:uncharacterized protein YbjT (DUF2867 family)